MRSSLRRRLASFNRYPRGHRCVGGRAQLAFATLGGALAAAAFLALPKLGARFLKVDVQATESAATNSSARPDVKLTSSGHIVAQRSSDVGPTVSGRLARIDIKEGDRVRQGQVIAVLESADRRAAVSTAQTHVTTAEAHAQVVRADLAAAELKAKRERALSKEGVSSTAAADDLDAQVAALSKQVEAADTQVTASRAEVTNLKVNLDYMTVIAPIDGTVIGKPAGVGAMVGPFAGAIAKLVDLSSIVVETDVPEAQLKLVRSGDPAEILLDAFSEAPLRGVVTEIGPRVDRSKATVTVKVKFLDEATGVLPDMVAHANFLFEALDEKSSKRPTKVSLQLPP